MADTPRTITVSSLGLIVDIVLASVYLSLLLEYRATLSFEFMGVGRDEYLMNLERGDSKVNGCAIMYRTPMLLHLPEQVVGVYP